jgi:hypothetical protein
VVVSVANILVIGIYMGIIFMTCAVVILTTIYTLKRGLGKTHPWKQKPHKFLKKPQMAELAESVPTNEPIEEQAQPPDLRKDDNTIVFTYTPSKVTRVSASPPAEETQATIPSPDVSNPEPEVVASSEDVLGTEPIRNKTASLNQGIQHSKSGQEEAAELKVNDAIPKQVSKSGASYQEPIRGRETRLKQPEPVNAGSVSVQSEAVQIETKPKEMPTKKIEEKKTMSDLSDVFSQEILEENDTGQLASSLNDVDISRLLEDARGLLSNLKKDDPANST